MKLLGDDALERSAVVANCRMNRERNLTGSNGYAKELGFNPLDFLKSRLDAGRAAGWLDLCCGTGKALIEAARIVDDEGLNIAIVGVDLVGLFQPVKPEMTCLRLIEASLSSWQAERPFDLITCVHGLHYVGDKFGLVARAASWLEEEGLFTASLDLHNIKLTDARTVRKLTVSLRRSGLEYDGKRRLLACRGSKRLTLPFQYIGSDDRAGPNYTGQPAVNSYYGSA
jgi:SAM-dependent methyltransferase